MGQVKHQTLPPLKHHSWISDPSLPGSRALPTMGLSQPCLPSCPRAGLSLSHPQMATPWALPIYPLPGPSMGPHQIPERRPSGEDSTGCTKPRTPWLDLEPPHTPAPPWTGVSQGWGAGTQQVTHPLSFSEWRLGIKKQSKGGERQVSCSAPGPQSPLPLPHPFSHPSHTGTPPDPSTPDLHSLRDWRDKSAQRPTQLETQGGNNHKQRHMLLCACTHTCTHMHADTHMCTCLQSTHTCAHTQTHMCAMHTDSHVHSPLTHVHTHLQSTHVCTCRPLTRARLWSAHMHAHACSPLTNAHTHLQSTRTHAHMPPTHTFAVHSHVHTLSQPTQTHACGPLSHVCTHGCSPLTHAHMPVHVHSHL